MSVNTLLISDTIIKERTSLHGNVDPKLIYPDIKVAQDMYVLPILGTALFKKIQDAVTAGDWTGLTNYKDLLDNYIIDVLIYYTLADLPQTLSYQLWNKGVTRKVGDNSENPSMSELIDISNRFKNRAEWYSKRLRLYLIDKAPTLYPEYLNAGSTVDTIFPDQNSFSMPIYLGDSFDNPFCNKGGFNGKPYSE